MLDGQVIIAHYRWICRKQKLYFLLYTNSFLLVRRTSWVEDEPEDVVNAMHASVWDGEFSDAFLIHVSE